MPLSGVLGSPPENTDYSNTGLHRICPSEGLIVLDDLFQRGIAVKVLDGIAAGDKGSVDVVHKTLATAKKVSWATAGRYGRFWSAKAAFALP
ncbi:hypothetical protein [Nocardiopsis sp. CA-288880]|uniref:hypothetical protein n=1 Tax=Nocardiopsis sp. CA-288880 TaxID=3239995 RepID=UPI003D9858EE